MANKKATEQEYISILDGTSQSGPLLSSPMPEKKKASGPIWKPIVILTAVVVLLIGALVGGGILFEHLYNEEYKAKEQALFDKSPRAGSTYFTNAKTEPEKSNTEVTFIVTEAFYTNDGHLAVTLCLGNGMGEAKTVTAADVTITNGKTGTIIAQGRSDLSAAGATVTVPAGGTANLLVYISPEHVKVTTDSLSEIGYTVTMEF